MLGELDRETLKWRAMQTGQQALDDELGPQIEPGDLLDDVGPEVLSKRTQSEPQAQASECLCVPCPVAQTPARLRLGLGLPSRARGYFFTSTAAGSRRTSLTAARLKRTFVLLVSSTFNTTSWSRTSTTVPRMPPMVCTLSPFLRPFSMSSCRWRSFFWPRNMNQKITAIISRNGRMSRRNTSAPVRGVAVVVGALVACASNPNQSIIRLPRCARRQRG